MILHMGYTRLQLERDSLKVVKAINSQDSNFTSQGPLIMEIQHILHCFQIFDVIHMGRQGNEVEDTQQWWHSYPDFISSRMLIDSDLL